MSILEQSKRPDIPCVILAGGKSRRFGSDKALARAGGERLIDIVIRRVEHQTCGPIAINTGAELSGIEGPVLPDLLAGGLGPLAGLHAAMIWASEQGADAVVTVPVDTPVLPDEFFETLMTAQRPAIAVCSGRLHAVHGIWPVALSDALAEAARKGMRAARDWAAACGASECVFAEGERVDPFFNVNTPEDLLTLERFLAER